MLNAFREAKQEEIARLELLGPHRLHEGRYQGERASFLNALRQAAHKNGLALIAEYKRASPSQGDIALGVTPAGAARSYAAAGATAISVLTEESRFKGQLAYIGQIHDALAAPVPLLRKDFLFHPLQVIDTARTPASALLLIVKLTPDAGLLRDLRESAEGYGMDAVVEILDEADLHLARASGARIIQVNARNLNTLEVDRTAPLALARAHKAGATAPELWIAASGLERPAHLREAREAGFDAVLIGTSLMRGGDPRGALTALTAGLAVGGGAASPEPPPPRN